MPLRKRAYFLSISKPRANKNYLRFFNSFLNFFNRLNIIRSSRQNMDRQRVLRVFIKWAYFLPISKRRAEKNYLRFFYIILNFFNRLNIIQSSRQKYGQVANFKAFRFDRFFDIFFLFFLTDLILSNEAFENMDRQGILMPFRKWAYFLSVSQPPEPKNLFLIYRYSF